MGSLLTGRQAGRTTAQETEYWDRIAREWPHQARTPLWRQHSDRVNGALLARWLPRRPMGFVLKTDLFEEAVGDGLYPLLRSGRARRSGSTFPTPRWPAP